MESTPAEHSSPARRAVFLRRPTRRPRSTSLASSDDRSCTSLRVAAWSPADPGASFEWGPDTCQTRVAYAHNSLPVIRRFRVAAPHPRPTEEGPHRERDREILSRAPEPARERLFRPSTARDLNR